jgi:SAM-dependent methyltransferase
VRRTIRLFRLFLAEQSDPEKFYTALAADSVSQVAEFTRLAARVVVDVGGGPGHFTREFQSRGASCVLVEPDSAELHARGAPPPGAVHGDGMRLPVADGAADVCFSSNVLEHVRAPLAMLDEMIRVTRPDGIIYLAFTNWCSPWGGHEMSPWHYLGPRYAEQRYTRSTGRKPKHQVGTTLFPVHVGQMLCAVRSRPDVTVIAALPRYYPRWCRGLVRIPGLREVATWNLLLVLRRMPNPGPARRPAAAGSMAAPKRRPAGPSSPSDAVSRIG